MTRLFKVHWACVLAFVLPGCGDGEIAAPGNNAQSPCPGNTPKCGEICCQEGLVCSEDGVCVDPTSACVDLESDGDFCSRAARSSGKKCGTIAATNLCGVSRSVDCGTAACTDATPECNYETNECESTCSNQKTESFCAEKATAGDVCGSWVVDDLCNAGATITHDCGDAACTGVTECIPDTHRCECVPTEPIPSEVCEAQGLSTRCGTVGIPDVKCEKIWPVPCGDTCTALDLECNLVTKQCKEPCRNPTLADFCDAQASHGKLCGKFVASDICNPDGPELRYDCGDGACGGSDICGPSHTCIDPGDCEQESDSSYCLRISGELGRDTCGDRLDAATCVSGMMTYHCGTDVCASPLECYQPSNRCVPPCQTESEYCATIAPTQCGKFPVLDRCVTEVGKSFYDCGSAHCTGILGWCDPDSNQCESPALCVAESEGSFCGRMASEFGKVCGTIEGVNNCTTTVVANCGNPCVLPETCTTSNTCMCTPEDNAVFCSRMASTESRVCGNVPGTNNCGTSVVINCGDAACGGATPECDDSSNKCVADCEPETGSSWFCSHNLAIGKVCGSIVGTDNCGGPKTDTCGSCALGSHCNETNACECDTNYCGAHGIECSVTGTGSPSCTCATGWSGALCTVCDTNYTLNDTATECINRKRVNCTDAAPSNASSIPELVWIEFTTAGGWSTPEACRWSCAPGYTSDGGVTCINTKQIVCADSPPSGASTILPKPDVTVTWNGTSWSAPAQCPWRCNPTYCQEGNSCMQTKIVSCTEVGSPPASNAHWIVADETLVCGSASTEWPATPACTTWDCNSGSCLEGTNQCLATKTVNCVAPAGAPPVPNSSWTIQPVTVSCSTGNSTWPPIPTCEAYNCTPGHCRDNVGSSFTCNLSKTVNCNQVGSPPATNAHWNVVSQTLTCALGTTTWPATPACTSWDCNSGSCLEGGNQCLTSKTVNCTVPTTAPPVANTAWTVQSVTLNCSTGSTSWPAIPTCSLFDCIPGNCKDIVGSTFTCNPNKTVNCNAPTSLPTGNSHWNVLPVTLTCGAGNTTWPATPNCGTYECDPGYCREGSSSSFNCLSTKFTSCVAPSSPPTANGQWSLDSVQIYCSSSSTTWPSAPTCTNWGCVNNYCKTTSNTCLTGITVNCPNSPPSYSSWDNPQTTSYCNNSTKLFDPPANCSGSYTCWGGYCREGSACLLTKTVPCTIPSSSPPPNASWVSQNISITCTSSGTWPGSPTCTSWACNSPYTNIPTTGSGQYECMNPIHNLTNCQAPYCTLVGNAPYTSGYDWIPGSGPNGGYLCRCTIPGYNHPTNAPIYQPSSAPCSMWGTSGREILVTINTGSLVSSSNRFSATTCVGNKGDTSMAVWSGTYPSTSTSPLACSGDMPSYSWGGDSWCSKLAEDKGSPFPVNFSSGSTLYLLVDEYSQGGYWDRITTRTFEFELFYDDGWEMLLGCDTRRCSWSSTNNGPNGGRVCTCSINGGDHPYYSHYRPASNSPCGQTWNYQVFANGAGAGMHRDLLIRMPRNNTSPYNFTGMSATTCTGNVGDTSLAAFGSYPRTNTAYLTNGCNGDASGASTTGKYCSKIKNPSSTAWATFNSERVNLADTDDLWIVIDDYNSSSLGDYWDWSTIRSFQFEVIP